MDKTLLKGLAILQAVAEQHGPAQTIDSLARQLQLTRSNVHRTLQTLAHAGFVVQDDDGRYRASMRLFELGNLQLQRIDVRRFALPAMRELCELCGETVHLSILEGTQVVYIDKIDSPQPVSAYTAIGGYAPAHAVATGKALLAGQAPGYADRLTEPLEGFTAATITTLAALDKELATVRRVGFAINRGEWREGVGGVAAVIVNNLHQAVAGLGISGPSARLTVARMQKLGPTVQRCAAQVSAAMGYRGG